MPSAPVPSHDPINHPAYYTAHPSGTECVEICEHFGFNVGNAIKYLWRSGLKTADALEELRKSRWYVNREIERLTRSRDTDDEGRLRVRLETFFGARRCDDFPQPDRELAP